MQIYKAPIDDMLFQLEAFGYDRVVGLEAYESFDLEMVTALLKQTAAFAETEILPTNRTGDHQGLKWDPKSGAVTKPEG